MFSKNSSYLKSQLEKMIDNAEKGKFDNIINTDGLSKREKELWELVNVYVAKQSEELKELAGLQKFHENNSETAIWSMKVNIEDPTGSSNVFVWSNAFRRMLGFNDEHDFPNRLDSWSDRLHPEDKQRTLNAFREHMMDLSGKTPYDIEYRLEKKDGTWMRGRAFGTIVRDKAGNPLMVYGALVDITKRMTEDEINNRIVAFDEKIRDIEKKLAEAHDSLITLKSALNENSNKSKEAENKVKEIENIVKKIASIASTTNILSLNASVESVRAGEQGNSFNAVAESVRDLANNTTKLGDGIEGILGDIVNAINKMTRAIENADKSVAMFEKAIIEIEETVKETEKDYDELMHVIMR